MQFTAYAMITSVFKDNLMKYIGYVEITAGLGLSAGPLLGGLLFTDLDYTGTLFFFGAINLFVLLLCQYLIPNEMNNSDSEDSLEER